jgi:ABC-type spermidine/putrescine transport system permease subunit II
MSAIAAPSTRRQGFRFRRRWIGDVVAHGYIWIWLALFALPFVATTVHSLELTILINLLLSVPAAYAFVRYSFPGKRALLSILNLSLYTPAAVMGLSLLITYAFLFHIPRSVTGLVAAYVVGSYPLMLIPIIVALRDLPLVYEEAAKTLGANRLQSLIRIELPLLGPGISAGVLLTFVIIFNEFLVTLFIAGPNTQTAALRVYGLTRTGFLPTTAALAAIMQFVSFLVVLSFFKFFGSRYLKGTYLI